VDYFYAQRAQGIVLTDNNCSTCEQLSRALLQLAYEHLKAEQRLMELALNSRDAVATSAAALDVETILQKRSTLVRFINSHLTGEHEANKASACDGDLTPSFLIGNA
jgi:hypothetical protein